MFRGKTLLGWSGSGLTSILGETWQPYQASTFPTPPFPEYTSGHSGFSAAGAEVLKRFTSGDQVGGYAYTQTEPLRVEPTLAEAVGTVLQWVTFSAAQEAGEYRLYGEIHFYEGNVSGLVLGRKAGTQAYEKARRYWEGTI